MKYNTNKEQKEKAVELLSKGLSSNEIISQIGIDRSKLSRIRKKFNFNECLFGRKRNPVIEKERSTDNSHYTLSHPRFTESFICGAF